MQSSIHHKVIGWGLILFGFLGAGLTAKEKNPVSTTNTKLEEYLKAARTEKTQAALSSGSLWNDAASYMVSDPRARMAGDVVTILVSESTNAVETATASGQRAADQTNQISGYFGAQVKELPNMVGAVGTSNFSGQGNTTRQSTLTTTISAMVKEVLPNGNMLIEASRNIRINNENQTLTLAGVIRPLDVQSNNTVPSAAVTYLDIRLQGKGPVSDHIKPGWLYRLLLGLLPF
jgi:flagellar L-ring protein FlgH